jgi:hypothetical protein
MGADHAFTRPGSLLAPRPKTAWRHRGTFPPRIARHGTDAPVRVIVPELTADRRQRDSASLMVRCDILFPELGKLFRTG